MTSDRFAELEKIKRRTLDKIVKETTNYYCYSLLENNPLYYSKILGIKTKEYICSTVENILKGTIKELSEIKKFRSDIIIEALTNFENIKKTDTKKEKFFYYIVLSYINDLLIAILDEIYDESLNKQKKGKYLISFVSLQTLALDILYNKLKDNLLLETFKQYLVSPIHIAILEKSQSCSLQKAIKELMPNNIEIFSLNLLKYYIIRATDVDFQAIILYRLLNPGKRNLNSLVELIRNLRAGQIMLDDIEDLKKDLKSQSVTAMTILYTYGYFNTNKKPFLINLVNNFYSLLDKNVEKIKDYNKTLKILKEYVKSKLKYFKQASLSLLESYYDS